MTRRQPPEPRNQRVNIRLTEQEREAIYQVKVDAGTADEADTIRMLIDLGRTTYYAQNRPA